MGNELIVSNNFAEFMKIGDAFYKSGFFSGLESAAQAVVKIQAGAELGVPPFAAMNGINLIKGRVALSYTLVGSLIKKSGRYDYKIDSWTDEECSLSFYERNQKVGVFSFSMEDAKKAGLSGKEVWRAYPRNLLFARALTAGARTYCPDVFAGHSVYTPEELGEVIEGEFEDVSEKPNLEILGNHTIVDAKGKAHKLADLAKSGKNWKALIGKSKDNSDVMQFITEYVNVNGIYNIISKDRAAVMEIASDADHPLSELFKSKLDISDDIVVFNGKEYNAEEEIREKWESVVEPVLKELYKTPLEKIKGLREHNIVAPFGIVKWKTLATFLAYRQLETVEVGSNPEKFSSLNEWKDLLNKVFNGEAEQIFMLSGINAETVVKANSALYRILTAFLENRVDFTQKYNVNAAIKLIQHSIGG